MRLSPARRRWQSAVGALAAAAQKSRCCAAHRHTRLPPSLPAPMGSAVVCQLGGTVLPEQALSSWTHSTSHYISFRPFRRHEPFDANLERDIDRQYEDLVTARNNFLQAAHEVQLSADHRRK